MLHRTIRIPLEMWLVMHEDLRTSRRVRVIYDFLAEALRRYAAGAGSGARHANSSKSQ